MKFLGQGFRKLEHEQDRHTDRHTDRQTDRHTDWLTRPKVYTTPHSRVVKNPRKLRFFGVKDPLSVKFRNSEQRHNEDTDSRFVFECQVSRPPVSAQTARCCPDKKFSFFRRHRAAVGRRAPKFSRWASHLSPRFPARFRPDRLSFAGVMSWKLHSILRTTAIYAEAQTSALYWQTAGKLRLHSYAFESV